MLKNEYKIINKNKNLIISFGGSALQIGGILPFEFLKYLSSIYTHICDLIFFIDIHHCWYHKGIEGISNNIDETIYYLNSIIKNGNYDKIIFMGVSAGGYAAILFGSLCDNVNYVISFVPQTILKNPINFNYSNLKNVINKYTTYILYGNKNIQNIDDLHHISHCENIKHFINVKIIENNSCNFKELRDNGFIKKIIDNIIFDIHLY